MDIKSKLITTRCSAVLEGSACLVWLEPDFVVPYLKLPQQQ